MNTVVALPIVAALPVAAPSIASGLPTQADAELVRAAQNLAAIDQAFEDLHRKHGHDANGLPLGVRRNENIATLITVPAKSGLGFQAKASALRLNMMIADQDQHQQIAVSLADDMVGAGPTTAPDMPANQLNDASEAWDRAAALRRTQQIVDLLRTCYVREGWKIDDKAAELALAYSRQYAKDGSDPDEGRLAAMSFFRSHGQSLDWVFDGDIRGLICGLAKHSKRANSVVDAELIALADEYIVAEQKFSDLTRRVDQMEGEMWKRRGPVPDALRWRQSDAEFGLPSLHPLPEDLPPIWDRQVDVNKIREERWMFTSKTENDEGITITMKHLVPSVTARARADEIIAAYDEFYKDGKAPRGYKKALREKGKAERAYMRIEDRIMDTRATSLEGMMAKIRCALAYEGLPEIDKLGSGSCAHQAAISIFRDIEALVKTA